MPAPAADFRLYHGNDLELLAAILARELARPVPGRPVLVPDTILIPQPAMRRWLQKTLAETHGIAANLRFLAPGEFVRDALDANVPGAGDKAVGDAAILRWRLWSVLVDPEAMAEAVFAPLQRVLGGDDRQLAAWTLAGELAEAFEKYQAWRRDWLRRWDQGSDRDDWQAELWRRATRKLNHRARRLDAYLSRLAGVDPQPPTGLPARVFAFATQNVSPDVLRVIASAALAGELHFFFLSPVQGWWGDLLTARERLQTDPTDSAAASVFADEENPLLRANGAAGRDFVRMLFSEDVVQPGAEIALYVPPDPLTRTGLLHRMQRDLLARRPPPARDLGDQLPAFDKAGADRSLQVHSCHTRLREVQVLHEQLRQLLESDPDLQARDIAVLTPDIDAYAPQVHAVFGGRSLPLQQIPYALGDGSAIATQPVAEAFMRMLGLPHARFAASEVVELLSLPAIAQALQLESSDFNLLDHWLREAGARWGIDASHRMALGAPAEAAYSWTWAIDRLLLGHACGNEDEVLGVAPWPELEGSAIGILDSLLQGLNKLAGLQRSLGGPHSPKRWQQLLSQAIDSLFAQRPLELRDRQALESLRTQVASFGEQAHAAGLDQDVPLALVQSWFAAALADSDSRQPFLTGGVTFGRMVPMRLVPFKVICLLGMNDGDFPRRDCAGSLNRLGAELGTARRQVGDRSIRDDDRALFLQLFAAAGQCFYLSYLGQDPRSGETLPPSVVVAELLDVGARYFANPEQARREMIVAHPLQPFAAEAFGRGDPRRISYHGGWRPVVEPAAARSAMPRFASALPTRLHGESPPLLTRASLFRGLSHPSREYLSERIGVRLPERGDRLPDAEPYDGDDGLHRFSLVQRVFDAAVAGHGDDREAFFQRLLAEGLVAPGAIGLQEVSDLLDRLAPALATWRSWGDEPAQALPFEIALNGLTLSGTLTRVHGSGLRQFSASKGHGKTVLGLGLDALVWSALGRQDPIRRLVDGQRPQEIAALPASEARARLQHLASIHAAARTDALPFMPRAGYEWFLGGGGPAAWSKARKSWLGDYGEGRDPWVRVALRGADPFLDGDEHARAAFEELATDIFSVLPGVASPPETVDD